VRKLTSSPPQAVPCARHLLGASSASARLPPPLDPLLRASRRQLRCVSAAAAAAHGPAEPAPARESDLRNLRELSVYLWPKDKPLLKARVVAAVSLLLVSKARLRTLLPHPPPHPAQFANVNVPYLFKLSIDGLSGAGVEPLWGVVALGPTGLLAAYGLTRAAAAFCNGAPRARAQRALAR